MGKSSIRTVGVALAVDTAIYAAGDLIGGKITFTDLVANSQQIKVMTAIIQDQAKQSADVDLILFRDDPTGTTFTNNAAFDVADADVDKICGVITFRAGQWFALNDNSVGVQQNIGMAAQTVGTTLYGALVSRGTPTFAATTDVKVTLSAERPD